MPGRSGTPRTPAPDGPPASLVTTAEGSSAALAATLPTGFGRFLGGIRFVQRGSVEEVVHLAEGMSDKCAASRIPIDGQKVLIVCPGGVPGEAAVRAEIVRAHLAQLVARDPRGVYGPDMACGADVLDLLAADPILGNHVTGLSRAASGIDINARGSTADGVAHAIQEYVSASPVTGRATTIQGFGMVGVPLALSLVRQGFILRGVSNATGALWSRGELDAARLVETWRLHGEACLARYFMDHRGRDLSFDTDPGRLMEVRTDVFVPAARTTVLATQDELEACRTENPDVRSVERFLDQTLCSLIAEAANHPLTEMAERYAINGGTAVLPDALINIGGMVGCYVEWRYRPSVLLGSIAIEDLADRCQVFTRSAVSINLAALRAGDFSRDAVRQIVRANRDDMSGLSALSDVLGLE